MRRLICAFVVGVVVSEMFENADDYCRRSVYVLSFPMNCGNIKGHYEWLWTMFDICNCTVCVKMVGKNDTLQLLLGRHCIFDIIKFSWSKHILYDYRDGRKYSDRKFRHWFCFFWSNYNILKWHCSNYRADYSIFLNVQIFRNLTVYFAGDFKFIQ